MKRFEMEMLFTVKSLIDEGRLTHEYRSGDYYAWTLQMDSLDSAEALSKKLIAIARVNNSDEDLTVSFELTNGFGDKLEVSISRPWYSGHYYKSARVKWEATEYTWERVTTRIRSGGKSYTFYLEV